MIVNLIFCVVSIVMLIITLTFFFSKEDKEEKLRRLPIVFIVCLYTLGELIISYKYIRNFPNSYQENVNTVIPQLLVITMVAALVYAFAKSNKYIHKIDEKQKVSTYDFYEIRDQIGIELALSTEEPQKTIIRRIEKKIKNADPVSSPLVDNINIEIMTMIRGLSQLSISDLETEESKINSLLKIREIKNKKS